LSPAYLLGVLGLILIPKYRWRGHRTGTANIAAC
jgi:hypothetical protein